MFLALIYNFQTKVNRNTSNLKIEIKEDKIHMNMYRLLYMIDEKRNNKKGHTELLKNAIFNHIKKI